MSARGLRARLEAAGEVARLDLALGKDGLSGTIARGAEAPRAVAVGVARAGPGVYLLRSGGRLRRAVVVREGERTWVALDGLVFEVREAASGAEVPAAREAEPFAASPMTGVLAQVSVRPGERVERGASLFVVEAMKMEYAVRAPRTATVAEVRRRAGERVALGEVVVVFGAGA